jgi:hypothetical protein
MPDAGVAAVPPSPRAADPAGYHDRLFPDVLEAVSLHRFDGPVDGALEALGSTEAMAVGIRQLGKPEPRETVGRGGLDQSRRIVAQGSKPGGY